MFIANSFLNRLVSLLIAILSVSVASSGQSALATNLGKTQRTQAKTKSPPATLTITLNDSQIATFKRVGFLKTTVPFGFRNRVDSIRLKRNLSFKKDDFVTRNGVDKLDQVVTIKINALALNRLDYQPILVKTYYSNYNTVLLQFDRRQPKRPSNRPEEVTPGPADSPVFFVRLSDERGLFGALAGMRRLPLKANFGHVEIEMSQVAGIRFNANKNQGVSVRLKSGDTISGTMAIKQFELKCDWGRERIKVTELESLALQRDSKFVVDPLHTGRWRFVTDLDSQPLQRPAPVGSRRH